MNVLKPIYPHLLPQMGFDGELHYKTVWYGNTDVTLSRRVIQKKNIWVEAASKRTVLQQ